MATLTRTRAGKRMTSKTLHKSTVEARMYYPHTDQRHLRLILPGNSEEYDLALTADDVRRMLPKLIKFVELDDRDNAYGSDKIE